MKILFKVLDYTTSSLMGAGTMLLTSLIVGRDWNMFLAMITGMVLGMVVLVIVALVFISLSTLFELLPVGMIITMFTGMATGMAITMKEVDFISMLSAVITFSLSAQLLIDLYNMRLRGEVPVDR